ncbi:N-acetyl-glucosamine-6-phosphate deacetylase [Schaereria dolodes]|nr:N-acetyl-glucosamine-6-phosphate deacetylase [Schaereria dolodes]
MQQSHVFVQACMTCIGLFCVSVAAIWPAPLEYQHGSNVLWLSPDVHTIYKLQNDLKEDWFTATLRQLFKPAAQQASLSINDSAIPSSEEILKATIERMKNNVFSSNFVPWKFNPRNSDFEPVVDDSRKFINYILIEENMNLKRYQAMGKDVSDESYTLRINTDGAVIINIIDPVGGIRALDSLAQLFYRHSAPDAGVYTPLAPAIIRDSPAFAHRGLNLDISRNYISPTHVLRTIDAMSFNKLNHLHLHASDAQSWPLEIPALPLLARNGAYHRSLTWTVADLHHLQTYALYRGVSVYLEIDLPGHTASIASAYPSLITALNEQPSWQTFSAEPPSGELLLNSTSVTTFLHTLLSDLLPRISPFSPYFHTGGDEINPNAHLLDPTVLSNSTSILQPLLQSFYERIHALVRAHGLTPIVWEETLLDWNLTFPANSVIIQTWRSPTALARVVAQGHKALFGDHQHWYLDCGYGGWLDPLPHDKSTKIVPPYVDYCGPLKNWRQIYAYDPLAGIPKDQRHLVLGGEVHLWAETTDGVNLDSKLWPRAAAAAEVMWSGGKGAAGVNEDVTRRLAEMRERMVERGIAANVVQMEWCLQNVGGCML